VTAVRCRYFAYGSNLSIEQMARRCPAAARGEVAALPGWRFVINRRGVATIVPDREARVMGLLWDLTETCEAELDRFEGVTSGIYRKRSLDIRGGSALVYVAAEERPGAPRAFYLERIAAAAEALGMAQSYRASLATWGLPVPPWLVADVLSGYALDHRGIHGPSHWLRVRANGLALAAMTTGADTGLIDLFALLHDSRRHSEGRDLGHGERAAAYVQQLVTDGLLRLVPDRLETLIAACAGHEHGQVSEHPTIGCCWDADRLELARLGRRPIASLLSTAAARDPAVQAEAWQRGSERRFDSAGAAAWGTADICSTARA
jgi:uncharacterized protein